MLDNFVQFNSFYKGYGEYLANSNAKLQRTNFINFYAQNYARVVKNQLSTFINELATVQTQRSGLIYLLKLTASTSSLSNLILNEILTNNSKHGDQFMAFYRTCLLSSGTNAEQSLIMTSTIECVNQLNNSAAVVDLISSVIEFSCTNNSDSAIHTKSIQIIVTLMNDIFKANKII